MKHMPTPWHFEWKDGEQPIVVAADGKTVAVLGSGNLRVGPYDPKDVEALGQAIADIPNQKGQAQQQIGTTTAADELGITSRRVQALIASGDLPARKGEGGRSG